MCVCICTWVRLRSNIAQRDPLNSKQAAWHGQQRQATHSTLPPLGRAISRHVARCDIHIACMQGAMHAWGARRCPADPGPVEPPTVNGDELNHVPNCLEFCRRSKVARLLRLGSVRLGDGKQIEFCLALVGEKTPLPLAQCLEMKPRAQLPSIF